MHQHHPLRAGPPPRDEGPGTEPSGRVAAVRTRRIVDDGVGGNGYGACLLMLLMLAAMSMPVMTALNVS